MCDRGLGVTVRFHAVLDCSACHGCDCAPVNFFQRAGGGWLVVNIPSQDAYIDNRPNHDPDHWITKWIRSHMEHPLEREERARKHLLIVSQGAIEMYAALKQMSSLSTDSASAFA